MEIDKDIQRASETMGAESLGKALVEFMTLCNKYRGDENFTPREFAREMAQVGERYYGRYENIHTALLVGGVPSMSYSPLRRYAPVIREAIQKCFPSDWVEIIGLEQITEEYAVHIILTANGKVRHTKMGLDFIEKLYSNSQPDPENTMY